MEPSCLIAATSHQDRYSQPCSVLFLVWINAQQVSPSSPFPKRLGGGGLWWSWEVFSRILLSISPKKRKLLFHRALRALPPPTPPTAKLSWRMPATLAGLSGLGERGRGLQPFPTAELGTAPGGEAGLRHAQILRDPSSDAGRGRVPVGVPMIVPFLPRSGFREASGSRRSAVAGSYAGWTRRFS